MANQHLNSVALSGSNVVFAAISGALAGLGSLVVLNIATTVGQGTGGFYSVCSKAVPVGAGAAMTPSS